MICLVVDLVPFDHVMTLIATACGDVRDLEEEGDHVETTPLERFNLTRDADNATCEACRENRDG